MKTFLAATAILVSLSLTASAEVKITDTFVDGSNWETGQQWKITDDGKMCGTCNSGTLLQLKNSTALTSLTFTAEVTPIKANNEGWKTGGLAIGSSNKNYWAFNLVESPDKDGKKHFVELAQMFDGKWNSQNNLLGTRQIKSEPGFQWQYNTTYKMRMTLTPEGISGQLMNIDDKVLVEISYKFIADAVKSGSAALRVTGMTVNYDNAVIDGK